MGRWIRTSLIGAMATLTATAFAEPTALTVEPDLPVERVEAIDPLACLQAVLAHQGLEIDLDDLRALSGEAWTPMVWSLSEAQVPVESWLPVDVFFRATRALGVRGLWHLGLSPGMAVSLCAEETAAQRVPIVSHLLDSPRPRGWHLVVSADTETDSLFLPERSSRRGRAVVQPREDWAGPVPGPDFWGASPIYTVEVVESVEPTVGAMLDACLAVPWSGEVTLDWRPGLERHGWQEGEIATLRIGPSAAGALADDVETVLSLDASDFLWRVRSSLEPLLERRRAALSAIEGEESLQPLAESLADEIRLTELALRDLWNVGEYDLSTAWDFVRSLPFDAPLVISLREMPAHERQLLRETIAQQPRINVMEVHSTRYGPVLTIDSPEQRARAARTLRALGERFAETRAAAHGLAGATTSADSGSPSPPSE